MHGSDAGCKPRRGSSGPRWRMRRLPWRPLPPPYGGGKEPETRMPKLFSYGTLQQEDVQLATFRRRLAGVSDALVGYRQSMVAIDDPEVVCTSGKTHHPIVAFTGANEDR